MSKDTGGPAFPLAEKRYDLGSDDIPYMKPLFNEGMTLRDYFAAKAMATEIQVFKEDRFDRLAERCYRAADAMLAERAK